MADEKYEFIKIPEIHPLKKIMLLQNNDFQEFIENFKNFLLAGFPKEYILLAINEAEKRIDAKNLINEAEKIDGKSIIWE